MSDEGAVDEPVNDPPPSSDEAPADSGGELDWKSEAEKWRAHSRKVEADNKRNAERIAEYENASKTELERAQDAHKQAEERASQVEREYARLRVAIRKGLTEAQAKRLVGDSEEELEADADELLETFNATKGEAEMDLPRRPRERLRSGASPVTEPEPSVKDIVDRVMSNTF